MRHTEFWSRLEEALGSSYARTWAETVSLTSLGSRTTCEALDSGMAPKQVWAAVWASLELPDHQR